jgi:hypothetical protein
VIRPGCSRPKKKQKKIVRPVDICIFVRYTASTYGRHADSQEGDRTPRHQTGMMPGRQAAYQQPREMDAHSHASTVNSSKP